LVPVGHRGASGSTAFAALERYLLAAWFLPLILRKADFGRGEHVT